MTEGFSLHGIQLTCIRRNMMIFIFIYIQQLLYFAQSNSPHTRCNDAMLTILVDFARPQVPDLQSLVMVTAQLFAQTPPTFQVQFMVHKCWVCGLNLDNFTIGRPKNGLMPQKLLRISRFSTSAPPRIPNLWLFPGFPRFSFDFPRVTRFSPHTEARPRRSCPKPLSTGPCRVGGT